MDEPQVKIESTLNRDDDSLPYGYYNPQTEGKLIWMCGEDKDGKITSVFRMDLGDRHEKKCDYLDNIQQAREYRDTLVAEGWKKMTPPKITFSFGGKEQTESLNRQQRRALQKTIKRANKNNPFK